MDAFEQVYDSRLRGQLSQHAAARPDDHHLRAANTLLNGIHPAQQAWRVHLSAWLDFCKDKRGLDSDRLARLRKVDNWHAWQQAISEIALPYFLGRVYGMSIRYVSAGGPDVLAEKGQLRLSIEIKTPGQDPPYRAIGGTRYLGKDEESIEQALRNANGQFSRGENTS